MKLVSQMGGFEQNTSKKSLVMKRLRAVGRRIPWGHVAWVLFALGTFLVALKAVSLLASTVKALGGAG